MEYTLEYTIIIIIHFSRTVVAISLKLLKLKIFLKDQWTLDEVRIVRFISWRVQVPHGPSIPSPSPHSPASSVTAPQVAAFLPIHAWCYIPGNQQTMDMFGVQVSLGWLSTVSMASRGVEIPAGSRRPRSR